jgi:hypothetical protein
MNLDKLKDRLGGKWYDVWWFAIDERFNPYPKWAGEPDFFEIINQGWLDMYYVPPTGLELKEAFIKSITVNSNPYYNEKYYDYEV